MESRDKKKKSAEFWRFAAFLILLFVIFIFSSANCNLRVSNEPCTDKATVRRVELARKRRSVDLAVYGECRDSNISFGAVQTPCVCEPVGMDHCAPLKTTMSRKT